MCWEVRGVTPGEGAGIDLEGGAGCGVEIKGAFGRVKGKGRKPWFYLEVLTPRGWWWSPLGVWGVGGNE